MIEGTKTPRTLVSAALEPAYEACVRAALGGRHTIAVVCFPALRTRVWERAGELASHRTLLINAADEPRGSVPDGMLRVDPAMLAQRHVLESLKAEPLSLIVIDDAEALSQWGRAFVPAFVNVRPALTALGRPPVLALTQALAPAIRDDIVRELSLDHVATFVQGLDRPNLRLQVIHARRPIDKRHALRDLLRGELASARGIVYAATIGHAQTLQAELAGDAGIAASVYHGQLPVSERRRIEAEFDSGELNVVIATAGFGARVNRADLSFVIHTDLPASLEAYYEEAIQAGRDGRPATSVLLYRSADKNVQSFFLTGRYPSVEEVQRFFAMMQHFDRRDEPASFAQLCEFGRIGRVQCKLIVTLLGDAGYIDTVGKAHYRVSALVHEHPELADKIVNYEYRRAYDESKLLMLLQYAETQGCRWRFLLSYFGQAFEQSRCGACDYCLAGGNTQTSTESGYRAGDIVVHAKFGSGTVERAERDMVTVLFGNHGYKTLLTSAVRRADSTA